MEKLIFLIVILNPFSQVIYLDGLISSLTGRDFVKLHFKASLLCLGILVLFGLLGDPIMKNVFQVSLSSLQIFGGIIIMYVAHQYITSGAPENLFDSKKISELPPAISMPYIIGPGSIWVSILIGREYSMPLTIAIICGALAINSLFITIYTIVYKKLKTRHIPFLGKFFTILMRTNALFIGAIAIEMILKGISSAVIDFGFIRK